MSLYEIRQEIDELEEKLKTDGDNNEIISRLHFLRSYENQTEEYLAGIQ